MGQTGSAFSENSTNLVLEQAWVKTNYGTAGFSCQNRGSSIICQSDKSVTSSAPNYSCSTVKHGDHMRGFTEICSGEDNGLLLACHSLPDGKVECKLIEPYQAPELKIKGRKIRWLAKIPIGGVTFSLVRADTGKVVYKVKPKSDGWQEFEDSEDNKSYYLWCRGLTMDVKSAIYQSSGKSFQQTLMFTEIRPYSEGGLQLAWTDIGAMYEVLRDDKVLAKNLSLPGYIDRTANASSNYSYTVKSSEGQSISQSWTASAGQTNVITGLTASCGSGGVQLVWTASSSPYSITRMGSGKQKNYNSTVNSFTDTSDLKAGENYVYQITDANGAKAAVNFLYNCSSEDPIKILVKWDEARSAAVISWSGSATGPFKVDRVTVLKTSEVGKTDGKTITDKNPGKPGEAISYIVTGKLNGQTVGATINFTIPRKEEEESMLWVYVIIAVVVLVVIIAIVVIAVGMNKKKEESEDE